MLGKTNSQVKPTALGVTSNSSTYGSTIPVIYGRTQGQLYLIWLANVRQGGSGKKGKGGGKKIGSKGSVQTYVANVDCLIGTNPIVTVLDAWDNNQTVLGLNFVSYSAAPAASVTIPDSLFYALLGITYSQPYSFDFDDYGGSPSSVSGTWEVPVWNLAFARPMTDYDPVPSALVWTPGDGPTITLPDFSIFPNASALNFYYAQMLAGGDKVANTDESGATPLAALRLTFEDVLGNGPQFNTTAYEAQKILYPHYAGLGSVNMDLGASGTAPAVKVEILGTMPVNSTGDADFADMVADIFGRATAQAGWTADAPYTPVQHALPCYDYPGPVYQRFFQYTAANAPSPLSVAYARPHTAGNFLVVAVSSQGPGTYTISDSGNLTWTACMPGDPLNQVWYAAAPAGPGITVTLTASQTNSYVQLGILEIAGVDTFDAVAVGTNAATVASSGLSNTPGYLLGLISFATNDQSGPAPAPTQASDPKWNVLCGNTSSPLEDATSKWRVSSGTQFIFEERRISFPGFFTLTNNAAVPTAVCLLAFRNSQPVSYPKPLGNILDRDSLLLTRNQCRAAGLVGSLIMDSQKKASDWLKDLYTAMNAAPVWSGFRLKSIPYSEVSAAGNGAVYIAPTAAGPVYVLKVEDFVTAPGTPPWECKRTAQVDVPNLLQLQTPNRSSEYNAVTIGQPENGAIAMYGQRKEAAQTLNCIQDVNVARSILGVLVRRQNYLRNTYTFQLKAHLKLLEPMDLLRLPADPVTGEPAVDVQLAQVEEDEKSQLSCSATPFCYGVNAPIPLTISQPNPYQPDTTVEPANVNPPVIFEPVLRLSNGLSELWIVVSCPDPNYGGCQVLVSTDEGESFPTVLGTLTSNGITGELSADWPADGDPDTVNDLALDLTESLGTLLSYQVVDEDQFTYPCYVDFTGAPPVQTLVELSGVPILFDNVLGWSGSSYFPNGFGSQYGGFGPSPTLTDGYTSDVGPFWVVAVYFACYYVNTQGETAGTYTSTTTRAPLWQPSHFYNHGDVVTDPSGHGQYCVGQGTSGAAQPDWDDDEGSTEDGTATWQDRGEEAPDGTTTTTVEGTVSATITIHDAINGDTSFDVTVPTGTNATDDPGGLIYFLAQPFQIHSGATVSSTGWSSNPSSGDNQVVDRINMDLVVCTNCGESAPTFVGIDTVNLSSSFQGSTITVMGDLSAYETMTLSLRAYGLDPNTNLAAAYEIPEGGFDSGVGGNHGPSITIVNGQTLNSDTTPSVTLPVASSFTFSSPDTSNGTGAATNNLSANPPNAQTWVFIQFNPPADSNAMLRPSFAPRQSFAPRDQPPFAISANPPLDANGDAIPYELMAYSVANLTGTNQYTLQASGGNHLRRSVFGAPLVGQGVDHGQGSRFAWLGVNGTGPGVLKVPLDPRWIGQTLYFKFPAFNQFGNGLQSAASIVPYTYTPLGTGSGTTAAAQTQVPANALSNPNSTEIDMSAVTVTFEGNAVNYNARQFTIPAPTQATTYFVTIEDPGQIGDSGTETNLTAFCLTSQDLVGQPGYTYIGSLVAQPDGGGTTGTPGGWPPSGGFLVNGT